MQLNVAVDFKGVQERLRQLQKDVGQAAMASALNKVMDLGRTRMARAISTEYTVSYGYARARLSIERASARGGVRLTAALRGGTDRKRSANVIRFVERSVTLAEGRRRAKQGTAGQLFVQIKRQGGKKPIAGAFIGNKGRTVFERVPGTTMASRSKYSGSLHAEEIRPVQTIDIGQMFNARRINRVVVQLMRDRFPEVFEREVRFFVDRFNRGAR